MTEYVEILFRNRSLEFNRRFLEDLIKALLPGCESIRVSGGKSVPASSRHLSTITDMFYNNGKGEMLFFSVPQISMPVVGPYEFGVYAGPENKSTRLVISLADFWITGESVNKRVSADLIKRGKAVYNCINPEYAVGDWDELVEKRGVTYRNDVFWINFYGPRIVERIGREKLRQVPYGTIDELADGGVLLIRGRTPDENSEHRREIKNYLFGKEIVDRLFGR